MLNATFVYLRTRITPMSALLFVAAILFATKASASREPSDVEEVFFAHNSSTLTVQGKEAIQSLIDRIKFTPDNVYVRANAEISETKAQALSEARAQTVVTQLLRLGITPRLIHTDAVGSRGQERFPDIHGQELWRFRDVFIEFVGWVTNSPAEKLKVQTSYVWLTKQSFSNTAPALSDEAKIWSASPYLFFRAIPDEVAKNNFAKRMLLAALLAGDEKTITLFADELKNCSQPEIGATNPYLLAIIVGSESTQKQLAHCKPSEWGGSSVLLRLLISQYCADGQRANSPIHLVASNLSWANAQIQASAFSARDIFDCAKYSSKILPWLIENGADLLQPDQQELTALDHAMMQGELIAIERLLDHTKPSSELAQRSLTRVAQLKKCYLINLPCIDFSERNKQSIREKLLPYLK